MLVIDHSPRPSEVELDYLYEVEYHFAGDGVVRYNLGEYGAARNLFDDLSYSLNAPFTLTLYRRVAGRTDKTLRRQLTVSAGTDV